MMKKVIVVLMLAVFLAAIAGCAGRKGAAPGQLKKQSAPGQMKKFK